MKGTIAKYTILLAVFTFVVYLVGACTSGTQPAAAPDKPAGAPKAEEKSAAAPRAGEKTAAKEQAAAKAPAEPYKIGVILAITGPGSTLGGPGRDAAQLFEEEINKKGGINGTPVKLMIYDTQSNETEAVKLVKKVVEEDKVLAIVGPNLTGETLAVIDTIEKAQTPAIAASAAIQIVEPIKKWVFKTPQSDRLIISILGDYLKKKNFNKIAWIHESSAFGLAATEEMEKMFPGLGINVVTKEVYAPADTDMTPQLSKVRNTNVDAIVAWGITRSAAAVRKNAKQLGIKTPIIHSHGVDSVQMVQLAGDAVEGAVVPTLKVVVLDTVPDSDPQKPGSVAYAKAYKDKFNKDAAGASGLVYDALTILGKAIEKGGADKAKVRDALENTKNYVGITGVFNLSPTDHNGLDKTSIIMVERKDGKWIVAQ